MLGFKLWAMSFELLEKVKNNKYEKLEARSPKLKAENYLQNFSTANFASG